MAFVDDTDTQRTIECLDKELEALERQLTTLTSPLPQTPLSPPPRVPLSPVERASSGDEALAADEPLSAAHFFQRLLSPAQSMQQLRDLIQKGPLPASASPAELRAAYMHLFSLAAAVTATTIH